MVKPEIGVHKTHPTNIYMRLMRQFSLRRLFVCDQWRGGSPIHFDSCLNLCMGKQQASLHSNSNNVSQLCKHKSDQQVNLVTNLIKR